MRALTNEEMDQVAGGWFFSWCYKPRYTKPKCDPKPKCEPKPKCDPKPKCEPKPPVCPPDEPPYVP